MHNSAPQQPSQHYTILFLFSRSCLQTQKITSRELARNFLVYFSVEVEWKRLIDSRHVVCEKERIRWIDFWFIFFPQHLQMHHHEHWTILQELTFDDFVLRCTTHIKTAFNVTATTTCLCGCISSCWFLWCLFGFILISPCMCSSFSVWLHISCVVHGVRTHPAHTQPEKSIWIVCTMWGSYESRAPTMRFEWNAFFLLCLCVHINGLSPLVSLLLRLNITSIARNHPSALQSTIKSVYSMLIYVEYSHPFQHASCSLQFVSFYCLLRYKWRFFFHNGQLFTNWLHK